MNVILEVIRKGNRLTVKYINDANEIHWFSGVMPPDIKLKREDA